jgi:hypothetical protein
MTEEVGWRRILSWPLKNRSVDDRNLVSPEAIQAAITAAVKKADPSCEPFVGVLVQRMNPKSRVEANWAIRGVKFGRADRKKAGDVLATIVERMQREFNLSDDRQITKLDEDED